MNPNSAGGVYYENRILTASPQRLQFLLLDAALTSARKAEEFLMAQSPLHAGTELARAETILTEIVGSFRRDLAPELVDRASAVYVFTLQALTDAHLTDDLRRLRDGLRVLEVEHETWRLAAEQTAEKRQSAPAPHMSFDSSASLQGGFTLEA